jgi:hypothetical protein
MEIEGLQEVEDQLVEVSEEEEDLQVALEDVVAEEAA